MLGYEVYECDEGQKYWSVTGIEKTSAYSYLFEDFSADYFSPKQYATNFPPF